MLQIQLAVFSQEYRFIMKVIYELGVLGFEQSTKQGWEMIVILCFIIC